MRLGRLLFGRLCLVLLLSWLCLVLLRCWLLLCRLCLVLLWGRLGLVLLRGWLLLYRLGLVLLLRWLCLVLLRCRLGLMLLLRWLCLVLLRCRLGLVLRGCLFYRLRCRLLSFGRLPGVNRRQRVTDLLWICIERGCSGRPLGRLFHLFNVRHPDRSRFRACSHGFLHLWPVYLQLVFIKVLAGFAAFVDGHRDKLLACVFLYFCSFGTGIVGHVARPVNPFIADHG